MGFIFPNSHYQKSKLLVVWRLEFSKILVIRKTEKWIGKK
jgi:hypothetical protein